MSGDDPQLRLVTPADVAPARTHRGPDPLLVGRRGSLRRRGGGALVRGPDPRGGARGGPLSGHLAAVSEAALTIEATGDWRKASTKARIAVLEPSIPSVRVVRDAEVILFSPQAEHGAVMEHMLERMAG